MNAEQLLDLLQNRGLLPRGVVAHLRGQVEAAPRVIPPHRILRLLIENGHLTEFQAKRLLREVATTKLPQTDAAAEPGPQSQESQEEEELGLAPSEDDDFGLKPLPAGDRSLGLPPVDGKTTAEKPTAPAGQSPGAEQQAAASSDKSIRQDPAPTPLSDGLNELLGEELFDGEDLSAESVLLPPKPVKGLLGVLRRSRGSTKTKAGAWDSPLILLGGGTLIVLTIVGMVLFIFLRQGSGDKLYDEAEKSYAGQSYSHAIQSYDRFLARHPGHRSVSRARVRRGLAHVRRAFEVDRDLKRALKAAERELPPLVGEPALEHAYSELAGILIPVASGLADKARVVATSSDIRAVRGEVLDWLSLTERALELINNPAYLPTSARQGVQDDIESIQENVEYARDRLRRDERLQDTVRAITEAIDAGATDEAYEAGRSLLSDYPMLAANPELQAAVRRITGIMGEQVRVSPPVVAEASADRRRAMGRSVLLARHAGSAAPGLGDKALFFVTDGAAYAIRASDGHVLWRRFVGFHPATRVQSVSGGTSVDAVLLDGSRQELQGLSAKSDEPVWRLPLASRVAGLNVSNEHVVLAEENGRVLLVAPESGEPVLQAVLTQDIATSVGASGDQGALLVVGDHSNLYVLAADSLECRNVIYVGHKPWNVRVPPVSCLSHLLVLENAGLDFALVHVLAPTGDGAGWRTAQKPLQIPHNVVVPALTKGPHVICLTDRGAVCVFEVNPANPDQPVREVARTQTSTKDTLAGGMMYEGEFLWVADIQLSRYRFNSALGEIERIWADHQGDTFLPWLSQSYGVVFHARRQRGMPGIIVEALRVGGEGVAGRAVSPLWSAELAVAPAGAPIVDQVNQRIVSVSARGSAYYIDAAAIESGRCGQPAFQSGGTEPPFVARRSVPLTESRWAFPDQNGPARWLLFDPASQETPFRLVQAETRDAAIAGAPIAFGDGLLVPLDNGQVHLVDPVTGEQIAYPFQPPLTPGKKIHWQRPAALNDGRECIIADSEGNVHRVGLDDADPPRLKARATGWAAGAVYSPLASLGGGVFAAVLRSQRQVLCVFNAQKPEQTVAVVELAGKVSMGPERVGQFVFAYTGDEGLMAFDETGERIWKVPLSGTARASPPVLIDSDYCLATTDGRLWRLASDGSLLAEIDTGEPIAVGPVVQQSNLLVSAPDGTIRILSLPE